MAAVAVLKRKPESDAKDEKADHPVKRLHVCLHLSLTDSRTSDTIAYLQVSDSVASAARPLLDDDELTGSDSDEDVLHIPMGANYPRRVHEKKPVVSGPHGSECACGECLPSPEAADDELMIAGENLRNAKAAVHVAAAKVNLKKLWAEYETKREIYYRSLGNQASTPSLSLTF